MHTTTATTTTDTAILDWIGLDEARHIATECAAVQTAELSEQ
jgi:hypothetical protein